MTATVTTARARRVATIFGLGLAVAFWALPGSAAAQTGLGPINLAQGKYAHQSSLYAGGYYGGDAGLAVDGNPDGDFFHWSVTHTEPEAHAWWEVDLGESRQIGRIEIANRTDCCGDRLSPLMVLVADVGILDSDITDADAAMYPGIMRTIVPNYGQANIVVPINRSGRFVRIALVNPNPLSLAEVQVIEADNAARGRSASQTSTWPGGEAWRAVDGNTSGVFASGSVAVTKKQNTPFPTAPVWTVDLGMQHDIREIHVWSSNTDCCNLPASRPLINVYVSTTQILAPTAAMKVGTVAQNAPAIVPVDKPGRFVAVDVVQPGPLSLAEVQVWTFARGSVGAHVVSAHGGQSSSPALDLASVDFNRNTDFHNYLGPIDQPYWDADLGGRRYLETVKLWATPGNTSLSTFHLFASDTDFVNSSGARLTQVQDVLAKGGVSHWIGRGVEPVTAISVMRPARFLRVQLDGNNTIDFREAEIVTTEGIALATQPNFPTEQRNNASVNTHSTGNDLSPTAQVVDISTFFKGLNITGYFPRPNTVINVAQVVPFMGSFAFYNFGSGVTGTAPILTSYGAAPMYSFTISNVTMPQAWFQSSVADLLYTANDNYGYTPTPMRGINDNGSEHVFWPDNRLVSQAPTPDEQLIGSQGNGVITPPTAGTYLDLPAGQTTIFGYPSSLIPSTVSGFKSTYGITPTSSTHAGYYNAGDLGIGRDMYCRKPTGFYVCLVDNITVFDQNHKPLFGFPDLAASSSAVVAATVVMVQPTNAATPVFGAYDQNGNRLNNIALDRTGQRTNIPNNCLTCHGGSGLGADSQNRTIVKNAYFLPFDLSAFLDRGSFTLASQEEQFRQLNQFVRSTNPTSGVIDLINGWYHGALGTVGQKFDGSYIPALWKATPGGARVYADAIAPYCRTCHITQSRFAAGIDFADPGVVEDLRGVIIAYVCNVHKMPHAQQTLNRFWTSGARAQLLGFFGRNDAGFSCGR